VDISGTAVFALKFREGKEDLRRNFDCRNIPGSPNSTAATVDLGNWADP
jgi:hypothetical protein